MTLREIMSPHERDREPGRRQLDASGVCLSQLVPPLCVCVCWIVSVLSADPVSGTVTSVCCCGAGSGAVSLRWPGAGASGRCASPGRRQATDVRPGRIAFRHCIKMLSSFSSLFLILVFLSFSLHIIYNSTPSSAESLVKPKYITDTAYLI